MKLKNNDKLQIFLLETQQIISAGFVLANMHKPDYDIKSKLVLHPLCKNILLLPLNFNIHLIQ
jgi:hypothetical protein